ncbi:hypothetical protein ACLOJK_013374 [Asimina triloba]
MRQRCAYRGGGLRQTPVLLKSRHEGRLRRADITQSRIKSASSATSRVAFALEVRNPSISAFWVDGSGVDEPVVVVDEGDVEAF